MNYAVLHFEKAPAGSADGGLERHIDRKEEDGRVHIPKNAIQDFHGIRSKELIPDVKSRKDAIEKRLKEFDETPGTRKRSANQIQVVRVILSGSHDQMEKLKSEGRQGDWEKASVEWAQKQFGKENVVSAISHYDEKTLHMHLTIIPITTRPERRAGGRKNKEKPLVPRLNVHDILTPQSLRVMQTTYAAAMKDFGFQRGIVGSDAKHISTREYYADQLRGLREEIDSAQLNIDALINELVERETACKHLREENKSLSKENEQLTKDRKTKRKKLNKENGSMVLRGLANIVGMSVDDVTKERDKTIAELKAEKAELQKQLNEVKRELRENADLSAKEREELIAKAKQLRQDKIGLNEEIKRLKSIIEGEPARIEEAKAESRKQAKEEDAEIIKNARLERDKYKIKYAEKQSELDDAIKEADNWKLSHYRSMWIESLIRLCHKIGFNNIAAIADFIYKGFYKTIGYLDCFNLHLAKEVAFIAKAVEDFKTETIKTENRTEYKKVKIGEHAEIVVNDPTLGNGIDIESWLSAKRGVEADQGQDASLHR